MQRIYKRKGQAGGETGKGGGGEQTRATTSTRLCTQRSDPRSGGGQGGAQAGHGANGHAPFDRGDPRLPCQGVERKEAHAPVNVGRTLTGVTRE